LHVLGGGAPYEEVMASAVCPPALRRALAKVWLGRGSAKKFTAVARTCRDFVQGTAEESQRLRDDFGEVADATLFDTLYRFVVLLGLPDELSSAPWAAASGGNQARRWFYKVGGIHQRPPGDTLCVAGHDHD
jgi:hypothetical protein